MTELTACSRRYPVLDRHGKRLKVGDRIRAQVWAGPYGQVRVIETIVREEEAHLLYGQMNRGEWVIAFDLNPQGDAIVGYSKLNDVEHGHETWAEIIGHEGKQK